MSELLNRTLIAPRPFSERLTAFIALMAIVMGAVSAVCFMSLAFYIIKSPIEARQVVEGNFITWIVANFHTPIFLLLSALFAGLFGVFFLRLAKASLAHIIPPEDRDLLGKLIFEEKVEGINLYIRLSSLRGFSGTFSHLGITGLPLVTVGLTLIFAVLAIWNSDQNTPNGEFLDLAKLTLGAFIGSFVQRQIAPEIHKAEADKMLVAQLAEAKWLADWKVISKDHATDDAAREVKATGAKSDGFVAKATEER